MCTPPALNKSTVKQVQRRKRGRKQVKANRVKVYRDLEKVKAERDALKKQVRRTQERLHRLKRTLPPSTKSKVNNLLRGTRVSPQVKKRLIFTEVLQKQLEVKPASQKTKQVIHRVISGRILKKYRQLKNCDSFLSQKLLAKYQKLDKSGSVIEYTREQ